MQTLSKFTLSSGLNYKMLGAKSEDILDFIIF